MKRFRKAAAMVIVYYLSNNPLKKLPRMLHLAEKLDKGNMHEKQIKRDAQGAPL